MNTNGVDPRMFYLFLPNVMLLVTFPCYLKSYGLQYGVDACLGLTFFLSFGEWICMYTHLSFGYFYVYV